jgi:hypothetical protein
MAEIGTTTQGVVTIQFTETHAINIEITEGEPIEYFIVAKVRAHCEAMGIRAEHFGLDVTAQQSALASIFAKEWSPDIYRCQFGGAAIREQVSAEDKRAAKDVYHNRVTELWYDVRQFAISGQIAGMSDDACREACSRLTAQRGTKIAVESKEDMRDRTSQSPDIFDGHVIIVAMAQERFHMMPGLNSIGVGRKRATDEEIQALDVDDEEKTYKDDGIGDDSEIMA